MVDYRQEYQAQFLPGPEVIALELWCSYYVICEDFDRTICTGPMLDDGKMPATSAESAFINRHAAKVHAIICDIAVSSGMSKTEFEKQKDHAQRFTLDKLREIAVASEYYARIVKLMERT